jgi:diguanylate cyclase
MLQKLRASTCYFLLITLLFLSFTFSAFAYPVKVSNNKVSFNLGTSVEYYEDTSSTLTLKDIIDLDNDNKFSTTTKLPLNFGYSSSTYWLSFSVLGDTDSESGWVLDVPYAPLDYVKLYVPNVNGEYTELVSGDKIPFSKRQIEYRNAVFILGDTLLPYQQYYIKVSSDGAINLPLFLWTGAGFTEHVNVVQTGLGIYLGIMFALFLYNIFLYFYVKDKDFLLCAFITLSYSLVHAAYNGMASQFLWPDLIWWANNCLVFFAIFIFLSIAVFTNSFLNLKETFPTGNKIMNGFTLYYCLLYVLYAVIGYRYASVATAVPSIIMLFIIFMTVLIVYSRGYKAARFLMLAWFFFIFGMVLLLLKLLGFLPPVFITEYSVQIGFILNAMLLSFALTDRVNLLRKEKEAAQHEAMNHLKASEQAKTRFIEDTEKLVEERTKELELANTRLVELASVDVLTGIFNRRVFNETLEREFSRAKRQGQELSIILIDIDYFKNYNDYYGHIDGDSCLAELADIFKKTINRATDTVARYGGEEFAVILCDTKLDGAVKIAEDIREAVVSACIPHKMSPLGHLTISCGVASTIPAMNDKLEDFISKADRALYRSKKEGRNMVSVSSF